VVAVVVVVLASSSSNSVQRGSAPPPASSRARVTSAAARPPLVSIFEADQNLHADPSGALDTLHALGVRVVRVYLPWSVLAPGAGSSTPPSGFDAASPAAYPSASWAIYDEIIRDAQARGMRVLLDAGGPAPRWAIGAGAPPGPAGVWKPSAADYGQFVHALATRYSGHYVGPGGSAPLPRVEFWSLWNEPNLGIDLAPEAIDNSTIESSPAMYRGLVDAGWSALQQSGHGADTILIGELAPYGQTFGNNVPGNFGYMVPLRFVRALYCVDSSLHPLTGAAAAARQCPTTASASKLFPSQHPALFRASGYAVHPYPQGSVPPNVVLRGEPDFANLAALPNLERLLDSVTSTYGAGKRFSLYSTEYGYFTNPPYSGGAPLKLAASYLNWAEYISWRDPRIRGWDQYLLVDPPATSHSNFVTGLEFDNGVQKPSYAAWRMPIYLPATSQPAGQGLEVWGCVRPARYAGPHQRVRIELQALGRGPFKPVKTVTIADPDQYFDTNVVFSSSGVVRLAWSYPHGPTIYSREVQVVAR
jgi:hypothetical protein